MTVFKNPPATRVFSTRTFQRFNCNETGAGTILSLFIVAIMAVIGGIAIDGANAWRARTQLQVTADSAALAAAAHVDDSEEALTIAQDIARRMLGEDSAALGSTDVQFGHWDSDAQFFSALDEEAAPELVNAVQVIARRDSARDNALGTYLMRLVGIDSFDISAGSIALSTTETGVVTVANPDAGNGCNDATFLSTHSVTAGGSNTFNGDVCIYGAGGVSFGGNDYYSDQTKVMANDISTVNLYSPAAGSAPVEEIKAEGEMEATLLPKIDGMYTDLMSALGSLDGQQYGGDLVPDFVKDPATGTATVKVKNGWWSIQPGQVEPYTIYVVNGGAQFSGGMDAHNVAFVVSGYLGVGGGGSLHFYDTYFMGSDINLAGSVEWGDPATSCTGTDPRYSVYMFAKNYVSLGGWGNSVPINGIVVAAPSIRPGGAMTGSNIYMESSQNFNIGGAFNIQGCGSENLDSYWELADAGGESTVQTTYKIRKAKLRR